MTPAGTRALYDALSRRFGDDTVFMDVSALRAGVDFVEEIERAVGTSDVLLVLIGKQWLLITDDLGQRRLDDPHDFVRLEVAAGLKRNARVIPVLVQGASMPREGDLPDELARLARRQAHELSDTRWPSDVGRLVGVLEDVPGPNGPKRGAASASVEIAALLSGDLRYTFRIYEAFVATLRERGRRLRRTMNFRQVMMLLANSWRQRTDAENWPA